MKFKRITENRAYEQVVSATKRLRETGFYNKEVREHKAIKQLCLDLDKTTTSGAGISGEGEFSGDIVAASENGYKVISIYIDVLCPENTEIVDITEILGERNPNHKKCDIRNSIPMSIIYWLEQFGKLPDNVLRHAASGLKK